MHTVSGKITRAPKIQQGQNSNGNYTAFFFELSEFIKGYGQEENTYTNYSVALFPKSQAAIDFHMSAIAEGSFVVINCEKLKIDVSNPDYPKIKMDNPRLDGFLNPNEGQSPQQQQAPQQQVQQAPQYQAPPQHQQMRQPASQSVPAYAPQQPPQQAPQQQQAPANDFDDDIPF